MLQFAYSDTVDCHHAGSLPDVPTTSSVFHAVCSSNLQYCVLHCYGPTLPYSVLVRYEDGQFVQGGFVVGVWIGVLCMCMLHACCLCAVFYE